MGKKCWYCGQDTQEPDPDPRWKGWYKCTNCGATHNPSPTTLGPPVVSTETTTLGGTGGRRETIHKYKARRIKRAKDTSHR